MTQETIKSLLTAFKALYGEDLPQPRCFFAPGRVNLIGEHTDYNDGHVLPFAINLGIALIIRPNGLMHHRLYSEGFAEKVQIPVDADFNNYKLNWWQYPVGIMQMFRQAGHSIPGFDLFFHGNLPHSAGLSSSASIEMVTAFALNKMIDANYLTSDLVDISRKAENEFIGLNCGIMDMYAIGMGKAGHVIQLDCSVNAGTLIPVNLPGKSFIVANTNRPRGLADSKYNERVAECRNGFDILLQHYGLQHAGELTTAQLNMAAPRITNQVVFKRLRHVISENERVKRTARALAENDPVLLGELMHASHNSLKNDYEVSCDELDILVEEAYRLPFTIGSRMTGAGFGGCTLSLIEAHAEEEFIRLVGDGYRQRSGRMADFYRVIPSDGVNEIDVFDL